jgi:hypothetical protein
MRIVAFIAERSVITQIVESLRRQRKGCRRAVFTPTTYAEGRDAMTAIWRPLSPARCEKNRSLSHRVHDVLTVIFWTPVSVACSAMSDLRSTWPGRVAG